MTRKQHLILEEITLLISYLSIVCVFIFLWLYSLAEYTKKIPRNLLIISAIVFIVSVATYWVSRLIREHKY